jgi:lysophospholipid acyltransferase (LPLAT)-like uncharacterized protein
VDDSMTTAERARNAGRAGARKKRSGQRLRHRANDLGDWLIRKPPVQATITGLVVNYLRLVNATSRTTYDPSDPYIMHASLAPVIFTMWHGQHFMLPFLRKFDLDVRVLISKHHDGELNARIAEKLGVRTVRGSTARDPTRMFEKGALGGFREMKAALDDGAFVCMTADISNLAPRRAGLGIVSLAKASGRPIVPVAYATSRRVHLASWDRSTLNLPFSRATCAVGEIVEVPADADDRMLESKRQSVEEALNEATRRAYAIVDRQDV